MKNEEQRLYDELYDRESRRTTSVKDLPGSPTIQDYPDAKKHNRFIFTTIKL